MSAIDFAKEHGLHPQEEAPALSLPVCERCGDEVESSQERFCAQCDLDIWEEHDHESAS